MRKFLAYQLLGLLGTAAGIPYILSLLGSYLKAAPFHLPVVVLLIIGQTTVLLAIAIFFGLKTSRSTGLPIGLMSDKHASQKAAWTAIVLGIITAMVITLGDYIFGRFIPDLTIDSIKMATWKLAMVPLYGGIVEELLMRLFFVSFFVWLFAKIIRNPEPINSRVLMWSAIALSALLFGLGHLPATAALTAITPLVVARAIVLNGIGGLVFGWLYWKRGLPYAMIAHATTDMTMFVIIPFVLHTLR